jgi:hypothetical protein
LSGVLILSFFLLRGSHFFRRKKESRKKATPEVAFLRPSSVLHSE